MSTAPHTMEEIVRFLTISKNFGNVDSEYTRGLVNGIELALSYVESREAVFLEGPSNTVRSRKIVIRESKTADTRSAGTLVTKEMLEGSSIQHIKDVTQAIDFMRDALEETAMLHDYTKLEGIKQFHADFEQTQKTKCDFTKLPWYQRHIFEERHHLDKSVPGDVNLFDVLEHIADIVMAGLGRTGTVYPDKLSAEVLEKAYRNTVDIIKRNTEVVK